MVRHVKVFAVTLCLAAMVAAIGCGGGAAASGDRMSGGKMGDKMGDKMSSDKMSGGKM